MSHPFLYRSGFRSRAKGNAGGKGHHNGSGPVATTWNPSDKNANITLDTAGTDGSVPNVTATKITDDNFASVRATRGVSSGKWYFEAHVVSGNALRRAGVGNSSANLSDEVGADANGWGYCGNDGSKLHSATHTAFGSSWTSGDKIGVALDMDSGKVWFAKNNSWQASGDPAAGTNAAFTGLSGTIYPMVTLQHHSFSQDVMIGYFDAAHQTYSAPSGFTAWGI